MGGFWNFFGLANRNDIENLRIQQEENRRKLETIQTAAEALLSSIASLNSTLMQTIEQEIHKTKMEQQSTYNGLSEQLEIVNAGLISLCEQNNVVKTEHQLKYTEFDEKLISICAVLSTLKEKIELETKQEIATAKMYKDTAQDLSQSNSRQEELLRIVIANSLADTLQDKTTRN